MTSTTPSPIADQAADLLEKAALVCENMACAPQFEPEIQDRMLRAAAKSIRALSTAPTTGSAPDVFDQELLDTARAVRTLRSEPTDEVKRFYRDLKQIATPIGVVQHLYGMPDVELSAEGQRLPVGTKVYAAPATGSPLITMLPDESLAEYHHRMLNLHIHTGPASPAASVPPNAILVTPDQRQALRIAIDITDTNEWEETCKSLRALLAASMGGDRS